MFCSIVGAVLFLMFIAIPLCRALVSALGLGAFFLMTEVSKDSSPNNK